MFKNYHLYREKQIALAIEIGAAVTFWVNLEGNIVRLCSVALGSNMKTTAHLLSNFKTFSLILDFTNSAVKLKIEKTPALKHWNTLVEYVRELSGDRNFIVHAGMVAHGAGDPDTIDWADVTPKVGPTQFQTFVQLDRREPMDAAEVSQLAHDFQHATECLSAFTGALVKGEPWPERFHGAVARRREGIGERRAKNHKGGSAPPRS